METVNQTVSAVGNAGSNLLSDIGSGLSNVWNSTKKAVSDLGSSVQPAPVAPAAPGYGGRRKRRGGQVVGYSGAYGANAGPVKGGSRKRRGGQVVGFDENWNKHGSVKGGSRRRKHRR